MSGLHDELVTNPPRIVRLNLDDTSTLVRFVRSGLVWQFPQYHDLAIQTIRSGRVNREDCEGIPAAVRSIL